MWDAIGVISYGLVFAFVESLVLFIVYLLLGFLVSTHWNGVFRITLLGTLALLLSVVAMLAQASFIWNVSLPGQFMLYIAHISHPLRFLYGFALIGVLLIIVPPILLILKSEKFMSSMHSFLERLTVLAGFYLVLDLIALIIVIVRNV
jgi:hypothetical protein